MTCSSEQVMLNRSCWAPGAKPGFASP